MACPMIHQQEGASWYIQVPRLDLEAPVPVRLTIMSVGAIASIIGPKYAFSKVLEQMRPAATRIYWFTSAVDLGVFNVGTDSYLMWMYAEWESPALWLVSLSEFCPAVWKLRRIR